MNDLNLKDTYFGFTNNLKPMQKARAEKTLDKLYRHNNVIMTAKEYIHSKVKENFLPDYEKDYSYYSRRTKEMTKPRTLYKLQNEENGYFTEVNKTEYEYALHILENGYTDHETASEYIEKEQQEKAEKERIQALQEQQAREEKQRAEEERRQKEKAEREEKIRQWKQRGKQLLETLNNDPIKEVLEQYWQEVKELYPQQNKDEYFTHFTQVFTEILGNINYCIHYSQAYIENENKSDEDVTKASYTIRSNPRMCLEKSLLFKVFNLNTSDSNRTITAKIKAIYEGREYKESKNTSKQLETFYILKVGQGFEERQGEKHTAEGITFFIHKDEKEGIYKATEASTGLGIGVRETSKREAIKQAKNNIKRTRDRIESVINRSIEKYGISPLYKQEKAT